MSLADRLLKGTTLKYTSSLETSIFFKEREMVPTPVPMLNVALSGRVDGGLTSGVTVLAGQSKNFKSGFALLLASSYLKKYPESVLLFYDSEFGVPQSYFDMFSIPMNRVIHTPVTDIEELKHDLVTQLKNLNRDDKAIIIVDSIGVIASRKEIDDTLEGKQVADMSRAKAIKSLFRMIVPHTGLKDIPIIMVNHTYKELSMYPRDIVSGGTGPYYAADTIWILGRQQDKDGTELSGYHFIINVEKSRFVKEKAKIPITVSFDKGIQKWAGLFDIAEELGYITSPSKGWYEYEGEDGKIVKCRRSELEYDDKFWEKMLKSDLASKLKNKYSLSSEDIVNE